LELARETVIVGIDELPNIYGRSPSGRSHVPVIGEDMAASLYTSGSTGYPKGAILSHGNLVIGARIVVTYLENCPDDVILSVLPFHFDYGLNQLITSFLVGATLVLQKSTFPSDICRTLIDCQITGLAGVPTLWVQLLKSNSPFRGLHFPAIRYITNSGGAVPVRYVSQLKEVLRGAKIYLMYGLTEAFRSSYLPPEELEARPTSIGKAIPGVELLVIDEQGGNCQAGKVGELVHRGGVIFRGYWNDPEGTSKILRPAPFASSAQPVAEMAVWSGDLVSRDEEGFLYFVGRKDEMIKSAGYRISPQEIEDVLHKMDLIEEAVAFGIKDDELGERISVVVSPRGNAFLSEELVMQLCRRHLPSFMVPSVITIIPELPKGLTGKLDRNRIKRDYGA
jgi:acyl-CoA synthetase (AMP-forming)/AMP-acid ligase II